MSPAQKAWAELGGLGPVPSKVEECIADYERAALAERLVAEQRHELRLRLIEGVYPALLASAHECLRNGGKLLIDGEPAKPRWWALVETDDAVNLMLNELAAEAKASTKEGES